MTTKKPSKVCPSFPKYYFLTFYLADCKDYRIFAVCYGIKLDLDSIFHHRVCDCAGEIGVFRRLRGVSCDDGLDVLLVENGL